MSIIKTAFADAGASGDINPGNINLYTLTNENGMTAEITNYGGIVTSLKVPGKNGQPGDVVLGFDHFEPYTDNFSYFGTIVGRYCGRISGAAFSIDGKRYQLVANDGENHLHGGINGFNKKVWQAEILRDGNEPAVKMTCLSIDGEEGYPGNLNVSVIFSIDGNNGLKIEYEASTDRATPVNLTHHGYFNLKDCGASNILDHELTIYTGQYAPSDDHLISTGTIEPVEGTPLDFRAPKKIGAQINELKGGYDHTFVLDKGKGELKLAAKVVEPVSGRVMEVLTTEPAIHLYTSNFLDGSIIGKYGAAYHSHAAFCLETHHIPDSVNNPQFPSTILEPGDTYKQTTVYRFSS